MEKRVIEAAEDYLDMKVDIEVLERLNLEISPRYTLKYSTRGGSNFSSSSTHQEKTAHSKRVGKTSGMILSIAAAKFAFIQGGRRPLGRDGRQAKAEYRFRDDGKKC